MINIFRLCAGCLFLFSISVNAKIDEKIAPRFSVFDYFDRNILVSSKISEITMTIHIAEEYSISSEEDDHSCIVYSYKFDKKGNLISETLNRVGTDYGYVYDENNKMYDWTWRDKSSGEKTSFREELKGNPDEFKKRLKEHEDRNSKLVASSITYTAKSIKTISDICFSLDAEYEVIHTETSGNLPAKARANKVRDLERIMKKGHKSAGVLYIYYDYKYFQ